MKKCFLRVIFFVLAACLLTVLVSAQEVRPVYVTLDGEPVDCASYGQEATIVEGRTLVPLRAIFEALGADVVWDKETRTVLSARNGTLVELGIGSNILVKNRQNIEIDVPAKIMNGRTMVPARAVAESFGVAVEWDKTTRTVILTTVDDVIKKSNGDFKSVLRNSKAYGIFNYGMTLQKCWDLISRDGAKKELVALGDGRTEIHISKNIDIFEYADSQITGDRDIILIRLIFEGDYLYSVYVVANYCDTLEESLGTLEAIEEYYGSNYESNPLFDGTDDTRWYKWKNENEKIECSFADIYESATDVNSRLGNNFSLFLTDIQAKTLIEADRVKPEDKPFEDEENAKVPSDEEQKSDLNEEQIPKEAEEVLVKAFDAVTTLNLTEAAKYTTNPEALLQLNISGIDSLLEAMGVDRDSMVESCIDELVSEGKDREDYRVFGEAVADVTIDWIKETLGKMDYEIIFYDIINAERIRYEVITYTPDETDATEAFGVVIDSAMYNASVELLVMGEELQEKSQKEILNVMASLFKKNADVLLDKMFAEIEMVSGKPMIGMLVKIDGEWRVELGTEDFSAIENLEGIIPFR